MTFCTVLLALILDKLLGETQKWHPLVGFGVWVNRIEARLNQPTRSRRKGVIAVILAVVRTTSVSSATWVCRPSDSEGLVRKGPPTIRTTTPLPGIARRSVMTTSPPSW